MSFLFKSTPLISKLPNSSPLARFSSLCPTMNRVASAALPLPTPTLTQRKVSFLSTAPRIQNENQATAGLPTYLKSFAGFALFLTLNCSVIKLDQNQDPRIEELRKAIRANDLQATEQLLTIGVKLDFVGLFTGNDTSPQILDLLKKYKRLPEGVTLSSLKLALFACGNKHIHVKDFENVEDINWNGVPFIMNPMDLFVIRGRPGNVQFLISKGVQKRPIESFYHGHISRYINLNLLDVKKSADQISMCVTEVESKCESLAILLKNPTPEMMEQIKSGSNYLYLDQRFLPFFEWMALANELDLFDHDAVKLLWLGDRQTALSAVSYAAAIGNLHFFKKLHDTKLVDPAFEYKLVEKAIVTASAAGNTNLLTMLLTWRQIILKHDVEQLSRTDRYMVDNVKKISGQYHFEFNARSPLFWAVRNGYHQTAKLLIEAGYPVNEEIDDFAKSTFLSLAVRLKDEKMVELLIQNKADVNHQDTLGYTPLHDAVKPISGKINMSIVASLLYAGSDPMIKDKKGKTALDKIADPARKQEVLELIELVKVTKKEAA